MPVIADYSVFNTPNAPWNPPPPPPDPSGWVTVYDADFTDMGSIDIDTGTITFLGDTWTVLNGLFCSIGVLGLFVSSNTNAPYPLITTNPAAPTHSRIAINMRSLLNSRMSAQGGFDPFADIRMWVDWDVTLLPLAGTNELVMGVDSLLNAGYAGNIAVRAGVKFGRFTTARTRWSWGVSGNTASPVATDAFNTFRTGLLSISEGARRARFAVSNVPVMDAAAPTTVTAGMVGYGTNATVGVFNGHLNNPIISLGVSTDGSTMDGVIRRLKIEVRS